jgi:hypothetical protein
LQQSKEESCVKPLGTGRPKEGLKTQAGERRWRVKKEEKEQLEGEKRNEENRQSEEKRREEETSSKG